MATTAAILSTALLGGLSVVYGPEQFRELVLKPVIESPDVAQIFTIRNGVKAKEDVLFVGKFSKITHLDAGCGSTPTTPEIPIDKLTWDPVKMEAWIAECADELDKTFLAWGLDVGYERYDLDQALIKIKAADQSDAQAISYWTEFIQDQFTQALRSDIFRIGFFGNKDITAASLTAGAADVKNYNQVDGVFEQVFAMATLFPSVRAYTIAANATADQELAAGVSKAIFRALVKNAPRHLKRDPDRMILCTQSIADNWADYREDNDNVSESWVLQETGIEGPKYRKVPIIPVDEWDEILETDFNVADQVDLPHRAILTTKRNLQLGFDSYDAATQVAAWFNMETKMNHMRSNFKFDVKVMSKDLVAAAY
ncbi:hypothetical protein [Hymenobacter metallicola]|uniref:Uncharacterized protein n=1 Tax=Hymenobacter metallicola TaxID=2563114 RepID=A0A4Z0PZT4_9BACT|nr:hypothetical protein [Hymenobacter metallicola]TGE22829.1 hypothetical protein E5K02_20910 [Hymenobacter metallicola]